MRREPFSSADFSRVPSELSAQVPEKLIHQNVMRSVTEGDADFSSERRHFVRVVDLPSRAVSMTIGGLDPRESTRMHRHNYETIIYVLRGWGKSLIEDREVFWQAGDAFYVPLWAWHQHINISEEEDALYIACENAPALQNLGVALREER